MHKCTCQIEEGKSIDKRTVLIWKYHDFRGGGGVANKTFYVYRFPAPTENIFF
jgi:hypothetical protein